MTNGTNIPLRQPERFAGGVPTAAWPVAREQSAVVPQSGIDRLRLQKEVRDIETRRKKKLKVLTILLRMGNVITDSRTTPHSRPRRTTMTVDFTKMNVREAREYAKENGIPGYSKYVKQGKAALIQFLQDYDARQSLPEQVADTQDRVDDVLARIKDNLEKADAHWNSFCEALKTPAGWLTLFFRFLSGLVLVAGFVINLAKLSCEGWKLAISGTLHLGIDARTEWETLKAFLRKLWTSKRRNLPFTL